MEELLNNIKMFFTKYPEYIYLIIGIIFCVLFIGALKDKKWAIDPASGNQRLFYNRFGYKAFRRVISIIYLIGTIAGFGGFFVYLFM